MMRTELTRLRGAATRLPMQSKAQLGDRAKRWSMPLLLASTSMFGGCVTVEAPDKPIVIELNVNIRQEVIYRLAADAGQTIEENEDIF